jgi:hypothetical protein
MSWRRKNIEKLKNSSQRREEWQRKKRPSWQRLLLEKRPSSQKGFVTTEQNVAKTWHVEYYKETWQLKIQCALDVATIRAMRAMENTRQTRSWQEAQRKKTMRAMERVEGHLIGRWSGVDATEHHSL